MASSELPSEMFSLGPQPRFLKSVDGVTLFGKTTLGLKSMILEDSCSWLGSWTSVAAFSSLMATPVASGWSHNQNWIWPFPLAAGPEFNGLCALADSLVCFKSEVKGESVSSQGPLFSPEWWVFINSRAIPALLLNTQLYQPLVV